MVLMFNLIVHDGISKSAELNILKKRRYTKVHFQMSVFVSDKRESVQVNLDSKYFRDV